MLFCADEPAKAISPDDERSTSDAAALASQIEALQGQIDKMRPALEALNDAAKDADADGAPTDETVIHKSRSKRKTGGKTRRAAPTSFLLSYIEGADLTEPSHDFHTYCMVQATSGGSFGKAFRWSAASMGLVMLQLLIMYIRAALDAQRRARARRGWTKLRPRGARARDACPRLSARSSAILLGAELSGT